MTFTIPDGLHLLTDEWECWECKCKFYCDIGDDCPDCGSEKIVRRDS